MNSNDLSKPVGNNVDADLDRLCREPPAMPQERPAGGSNDDEPLQGQGDRARERTHELSHAQKRFWFLEQLEGVGASYNINRGWWLQGAIDVVRLRHALAELIARQDSLRTVFLIEKGQPRQSVQPGPTTELALVELHPLPGKSARVLALERAQTIVRQGFDLAKGPLLRVTLIRVAESTHLLVIAMHHIISDGWSMGVLYRELATLYAGDGDTLPALLLQYPDYVKWQRAENIGEALEDQLAYWRGKLEGLTPLELPTDRPRPPAQSYRGGRQPVTLSSGLTGALKALGRRQGVTLHMTLLAAFQVLLCRYSAQNDIAVGSPIAGRGRRKYKNLIGLFINTLVLRTDLSGNPGFTELLSRVRDNALKAYAHQDVPFEKLVEALKPERDLSRSPLFQVMFVLQNTPGGELTLPGVEVAAQALDTDTAKFDLTLSLSEGPGGLHGELEYASDLFDASTIERMAGHITTLLEGIVADPETPVGELPLLTPAERHQLLVEWNDTAVDYPRDRCVHQLFEEQAARTPTAVALVFEDRQLTYAELNARANRLAHHLITLGVGPDVLVGICLERSLELIVGLLAILKAGGAYVPLDLSYPKERLAFMLTDTQAPVLITQEALLADLPPHQGHILCLDRDWPRIGVHSRANPTSAVTSNSLAYVIYTSGSTGKPKGVMITHANVVRLLLATQSWFCFGERDVWTCFHSSAFDFSVWEIWGALTYGGRLVMVPYRVSRDPVAFLALLRHERVTVVNQTPSAFRQLMAADAQADIAAKLDLRLIIFGGEALDMQSLRPWFDRHGDSRPRLVNMYGITETTVHVTYRPIRRTDLETPMGSRIGERIPDLRVYILNPYLQPVPVGVAGEIVVGGAGVARGYLNRPELTTERFVDDPFANQPGARMYRSGDLARYGATGDIEYLGRIDHQVKLRGFRIELGEIEAVLVRLPQVREAVVQLREDTPGDKRLVAYVVAEGTMPAAAELRAVLKAQLPEYMIPAVFIPLPALPLTPNGKLDRKALPAPDGHTEAARSSPPRNPVEEAVAGIWCELLHLDRVGVHDNYFDLGGHSLLAIQLLSRLRDVFGVELSVRHLFEAPTIAELGERTAAMLAGDAQDRTPIQPQSRGVQLLLSYAQQRLWFLDRLLPGRGIYNIPVAWRLKGILDQVALERSLDALAARHEPLRTRFAVVEGEAMQVIDPPAAVELLLTDVRVLPQAEREAQARRIADTDARQGFDLQAGPVWRAQVLRLADDEHWLLFNVHHIAFDGWSLGVFGRELSAAYGALVRGREPDWPALSIQYADYAQWQREWLQDAVLERQLAYWRGKLEGLTPLELPTDRPRPPAQSYRGGRQPVTLSSGLTGALKALGRRQGATLHMTLLAAFQVLLCRYSAQNDIAVGSPIAGRGRSEFEGLIGLFINTLVLRTDLSGNPGFTELLSRVRDNALKAYAHQDVPFEKLVEALKPERDLSRSPLFQVMFVLQNTPGGELTLPGVEVAAQALDTDTAKFDLTLSLSEGPGGLHGELEYASDLFDASTIERMAGHITTLLEGIVADPETPVGELPLLTPAERHQLLVEWNDTAVDYPRDRCVHQLFEEQAARTPTAVALVFEDRQLTYAELNARANRLAHHLITLGVGPDVLVGIYGGRSLATVVAMLAILKARGAYVPFDPDLPKARLGLMLADTGARVLLAQRGLPLPDYDGLVLALDEGSSAFAGQSAADPEISSVPEQLAYVMYTSGSTGVPKGVAVPHRAVVRLIYSADYASLDGDQVFMMLAPLAFDASTFEVWGALLHGARCVVVPEHATGFSFLQQIISRHGVTTAWLTSALFNAVIDEAPEILAPLRQLLTGGEALSKKHVRRAQHLLPGTRLVNGYGPTEGTTFTCCFRIQGLLLDHATTVPIGRPIANTVVYVLDQHRQPVPVGIAGELYIGGDGLARGYWNRAELTAERFVPDPFSAHSAARLYRTGDLVHYLPDGNIEYLGRIDHQVKLRGFRIELGEIEAVLVRLPQVREAVVQLREDTPGDKRLVAYVVAEGTMPAAAELRAVLKAQLPEYMIPAVFIPLPALPLTPNGKLDRKALPVPRNESGASQFEAMVPRDNIERHLVAIWETLLSRDSIGVRDNFFDLGGHSLLAMRLMDQIEKNFRKRLPMDSLWFHGGTIESLAALVRDEYRSTANPEMISIKSGSRRPLFVVHSVGGNLWHYYDFARHLDADQAVYGLQARGVFGNGRPDISVEAIAVRCLESMRAVQPNGPYMIAGYSSGGVIAYEMAQQLANAGEPVALLGLIDSYCPQRMTAKRWLTNLFLLMREKGNFRQIQELTYFFVLHHLNLERLRNLRTVGEAQRWAHWRYRPTPYKHPVEFFVVEESSRRMRDDTVGWSRWISGDIRLHRLPGDHKSLVKPPVVLELAAKFQACIDGAGAS